MTLDFNEDLNKLLLEITAFQSIDDSEVKTAKMIITKEQKDYLENNIGIYLPVHILEALIKEIYECNTDKDYENALSHFEEKELNELLLRLDVKFKNLWNE